MQLKTRVVSDTIQPALTRAVHWSNRHNRNRIALLGLILLACYVPTWLGFMWSATLKGSSFPLLNLGFLFFGLQAILQFSKRAGREDASVEDVFLGALAIIGCGFLFFLSLSSSSLMALAAAGALVGVLLILYGGSIFAAHPLKLGLLMVAIYPNLTFLFNSARLLLTGELLERIAAQGGSWGLKLIGQDSSVNDVFVFLGDGSVKVAPGCSGFDMAVPIAGMALMMGLFFKLHWKKTALLIVAGVFLSLLFNIPRIMVLANAAVYWGEDSFHFWHDSWGGQIFSGLLFTVYYYIAMPIIGNQENSANNT